MYGTIARLRVKPGALEALEKFEQRRPAGFVRTIIYRLDRNPDELMMVVLFKDKASYTANANSPTQNEEYLTIRSLLQADPEWFDGEVVFDTDK